MKLTRVDLLHAAARGDVQFMMMREPAIHAELLMQGAFREAIMRAQGRITVVPDLNSRLASREQVKRVPKRRRH